MEHYFRVRFTAKLLKFSLAFKAQSQIDVFWKKGQKIAQSSKVPLINTNAIFNQQLSINCNMVFDTQAKQFKEKTTKFEVVLYTEKGNKKVGEVKFDVSRYLNERLKVPKDYEMGLEKCPDPNAKLVIRLSATVEERISADAISQSSERTVNIETLVDGKSNINIENNKLSQIRKQVQIPSKSVIIPTKDVTPQRRQSKTQKKAISSSIQLKQQPQREGSTQKIRDLQAQNKRMRERLIDRERLSRQNQQLRRKIKTEQYQSVRQTKDKIEACRKQIQKLQANIKKQFLLAKQVKSVQDEIFKCKYQIMTAFNYANERGGGKLMFQMQQACGLKER